jgi:hypothetical protein
MTGETVRLISPTNRARLNILSRTPAGAKCVSDGSGRLKCEGMGGESFVHEHAQRHARFSVPNATVRDTRIRALFLAAPRRYQRG